VTELGMRVGCKPFGVFYHILNSFVGSVGCSMVDVDRLKLNVKRGHVAGVEPNDVFSDS
jgi:hypothetical protein